MLTIDLHSKVGILLLISSSRTGDLSFALTGSGNDIKCWKALSTYPAIYPISHWSIQSLSQWETNTSKSSHSLHYKHLYLNPAQSHHSSNLINTSIMICRQHWQAVRQISTDWANSLRRRWRLCIGLVHGQRFFCEVTSPLFTKCTCRLLTVLSFSQIITTTTRVQFSIFAELSNIWMTLFVLFLTNILHTFLKRCAKLEHCFYLRPHLGIQLGC